MLSDVPKLIDERWTKKIFGKMISWHIPSNLLLLFSLFLSIYCLYFLTDGSWPKNYNGEDGEKKKANLEGIK